MRPAALVRSVSPKSRLFTRTDISPSCAIVAIKSIALRPSRSIFDTTSMSPGSSPTSRAKPGRFMAATLPETVLVTMRYTSTAIPAVAICCF